MRGRERPIIFSAPMVQAILDGRKTQTRRLLKPLNDDGPYVMWPVYSNGKRCGSSANPDRAANYSIGDLLWVREAWNVFQMSRDMDQAWEYEKIPKHDPRNDEDARSHSTVQYAQRDPLDAGERWRPSIHMPKWAARIWLRVTDVRVERLQDISEADARAEGVEALEEYHEQIELAGNVFGCGTARIPRSVFRNLWDSLNGKRGYGWDANPWVVAITFERTEAPS